MGGALPLPDKEELVVALGDELPDAQGEGECDGDDVAQGEAEVEEMPEGVISALSLGLALATALMLAAVLLEGMAVAGADAEAREEALLLIEPPAPPPPPPPPPELRLTLGEMLALGLLVGEREGAVVREADAVLALEAVPMAPVPLGERLGAGAREGVLAEQELTEGTEKVLALGVADGVEERLGLEETLARAEREALGVDDALPLLLPPSPWPPLEAVKRVLGEALTLPPPPLPLLALGGALRQALRLAAPEALPDLLSLELALGERVTLGLPEGVLLTLGERLVLGDAEGESVTRAGEGEARGEGVPGALLALGLALSLGLALGDCEWEAGALPEGTTLRDKLREALEEGQELEEAVREAQGEAEEQGVG